MGGGRSKPQIVYVPKDDPKVKELEQQLRDLRRGDEQLERKRREEMEERREIREANERMIRSVMDRMHENQVTHDEEVSRTRAEFEERRMKWLEENAKNLKMSEAEHKMQMTKMEAEFKMARRKLDEQFEKSKKEGEEKVKDLENQNEKIKLKGFEELNAQREDIRRQESECRKEIEGIRKKQEELRNQMFEEARTQRQLEFQETLATAEKMNDYLERKYSYEATLGIVKQYLKIMDTIGNTTERLREIQVLCTGELNDDMKCDSEFYLKEISKSKNDFKNQVNKFQQLVINNTNAHQETVQLCREYLQKFETLIESQDFVKLCVQLPYAMKSNNECPGKIRMLGECARTSYTEFQNARSEITGKLNAIESHNQKPEMKQIEN